METLYDVQQLLKQFGVYIYVGKRIYDIELIQMEVKNLYDSRLIDRYTYLTAWRILKREHRIEESREENK
ncbi:YqgQ family protein [Enterococcus gallinarum]|uniref:YqgQ family protein n=1 Tax=Enterococcus gallinarum TaxID=1353 RepID=UPI00288CFAE3|nr:YqgQ family protein [Enterococcus gallinarum]MDT2708187.1 YqgQ family protein [Enterococcus gallinarum]MDT2717149.1 YqgQ family protein [Enterococcus gallinarum]